MGFPMLVRRHLYIESGPRAQFILPGIWKPIVKIRWSQDHLIFIKVIPIPIGWHLPTEMVLSLQVLNTKMPFVISEPSCGDKRAVTSLIYKMGFPMLVRWHLMLKRPRILALNQAISHYVHQWRPTFYLHIWVTRPPYVDQNRAILKGKYLPSAISIDLCSHNDCQPWFNKASLSVPYSSSPVLSPFLRTIDIPGPINQQHLAVSLNTLHVPLPALSQPWIPDSRPPPKVYRKLSSRCQPQTHIYLGWLSTWNPFLPHHNAPQAWAHCVASTVSVSQTTPSQLRPIMTWWLKPFPWLLSVCRWIPHVIAADSGGQRCHQATAK